MTGQDFMELGGGLWNLPPLRKLVEKTLREQGRFEDFRIQVRFPEEKAPRVFLLNGHMVECVDRQVSILLAITEAA
jgi:hypothetical protein